FIHPSRLASHELRGFWQGPPDLVIEVLSPDDRAPEIRAKVEEYLAGGVTAVVVIDPDNRPGPVHPPPAPTLPLTPCEDVLHLDNVMSGFRCSLREIVD